MEKIRQNTIVSQVMDHMKQLIADGVYSPGDKIPTEQELAQELGVGRSSIREAIKIFNHLGVMESKSALGTFICERSKISKEALTWALLLGDDEIDEVIEMRGAIELWSFIRLTLLNHTQPEVVKPQMDRLADELENMQKAVDTNSEEKLIEADYNFHLNIIRGGNNTLFLELYKVLRSFMIHEIKKTQDKNKRPDITLKEHQTLLEAIRSGDIVTAEKAFIDHINNIKALSKSDLSRFTTN
ncbi:MAG: FadR/GntR family transcriptional regulator [Spirochaetaceae bacterium]